LIPNGIIIRGFRVKKAEMYPDDSPLEHQMLFLEYPEKEDVLKVTQEID